jgi:O-antigen/teichoic acid export membrane protein
VGLAMVAPLAVTVIFGQKWVAAIPAVRWLAIFMIVRTMGTLTEQVLISQRMTRFTMRMSIFNFVIMPVAFVAAAHWLGTRGVAAAWVALSPFTILPLLILLFRTVHLPYRQYLAAVLPALSGSAVMSLAVMGVLRWMATSANVSPKAMLAVAVLTGAAAYTAVIMGFFRERVMRYGRFLGDMRKRKSESVPVTATP